jgi:alanine-synthesizing transaminase
MPGGSLHSQQVFSSRLKWDSHPNPLSTLLTQKRAADAKILDLTESNPTNAELHYPKEAIFAALTDPRAMRYEPTPRGILSAREAVSRYYAERSVAVGPSRILLTASTSEAYAYLFKLLCNPGDEILVPRPSYPLFEYLAAMESVHVKQYPLRYDGSWHIDFEALTGAMNNRTRAIVVVNPNNPTGSFIKRDEWQRLKAFRLPVLSDEVFSDFAFAPDAARVATLAQAHGDDALTFSMSGLSKIAGLPQMKLGWIVAGGRDHQAALDGLEWIADTFLSVATPVQWALPKLLELTTPVQREILERCRANLTFLRTSVKETPCHVLHSEGGWYAILQVPRTRSEEEWTLELLDKHDVLTQPGFFYDFESEAFLVLSLLTPPAIFAEGVLRILNLM